MSVFGDLHEFSGETFVAFLDISGFKEYLKPSGPTELHSERAVQVLGDFYQAGFDVITNNNEDDNKYKISGIFISDCGILFIRFGGAWIRPLKNFLEVINKINIKMINNDHLTTCSIAYGDFNYQNRISSEYIRKNPIFGIGYLNAFTDNEYGSPKIRPGDCRIVTKGFPPFPRDQNTGESVFYPPDEITVLNQLKLIKSEAGRHYYYYWMLNNEQDYAEYNKIYNKIEEEKYDRLKNAIKQILHGRGDLNRLSDSIEYSS